MKDLSKIYTVLLEKFGEPIGKQKATVGAVDNGPLGKALWNDEPKKDRPWSDPTVIDENHDIDGIIAQYADADMSAYEIVALLVQNGVPKEQARSVALDMRPGDTIDEAKKKPGPRKGVRATVSGGVVTQHKSKKPKNESYMPTTLDECCGKMPKSIDEAPMAPDDFDNYDRTGSEDVQRQSTTPEAIADVVNDWYTRHGGKVDRPDTGIRTSLKDMIKLCQWFMIGGEPPSFMSDDSVDPVGSLWQIEEHLKLDYLHFEELSQALYALISDPERV